MHDLNYYSYFCKQNYLYMDIKARIEEVIAQRGLTKREVSERMGKFNQAFNSLITNPKWDTIELVAQAIGISTEELLFGKEIVNTSNYSENATKSIIQNIDKQNNNHSLGVIICPYCGRGIQLCLTKV